ncbi:alpha/beta hydrolase [Streptomyces sp. NBC_01381]|uniref:alpha/beta hydrolase n=1 Tax=Streptomyces sp. NBC_01381 TaxID=2903845 RepID=UPI0022543D2A|nr:alpha/beta hydrolase [Streptomyces sp. NBC_01381]MCX4670141.1 alpha/beta hydrolase [Streptomyces sp. NBC_01381]
MNRLALTLAVLIVAASLGGCTAAEGSTPELKRFYGQQLKWKDCGDLQCARLTVPMDYDRPGNGKTFVLPVAKAATADPDKRIGSLVYNPGGPGASGVSDLKDDGGETFSAAVRARFDIVSFDPRGVGGSTPAVKCAEPDDTGTDTDTPEPLRPDTAADRSRVIAGADAQAEACREKSRRILRHVGTDDAARDMDVLRAAIGDRKLTYLGWSYGTSLGTSYAEQFPRRVRALALDGAVDPSLDWQQRAISQGAGFRRAVDDYAEYCADFAGDSCPGATPQEISELIDGLYEETAREPLPADGDAYDVDARTLLDVVTTAMYTPEADWKDLSEALSAAADGDGTPLADLAEGDGEGATESRSRPRAVDNSDSAILAVSCLDTPHPRNAAPYWNALAPAEKAAGVYGTSSVLDELTCRDWPAGTQRPHRVRADGVPPVLVVGTTGDPATPYEEAESLADQFPGGMLLTYEGVGHTAYGRGDACVTRAVDDYLIDREPVRKGKTC